MRKLLLKISLYIDAYNEYDQAKTELSRMSDYELTDIGITRCDINRIAKNAFTKKTLTKRAFEKLRNKRNKSINIDRYKIDV